MLKLFKNKNLLFVASIIIIMLMISNIALSTDINVVKYEVETDKVSEEIRIVLITDLHSCDYGANQKDLLDKIYIQKPDIVLLGGDIVDDILPQKKAKEFLEAISQKYLCYYVSGNHEFWGADIEEVKEMIRNYGIHVLEGENINLKIKGQIISISGVDDPEVGEKEFYRQLEACGANLNKDIFSVLFSHRPERIESYSLYGFDLALAGHAHGGQWRIPGILNGLLAPHQGLFPKYSGGYYEFENSAMVVSRGLAKESTRIPRIFNRPEIVVVDIMMVEQVLP